MALSAVLKKELSDRFADRVRFDEPMADHTTFRIGGPADAFVTATSEQDLAFLLPWLAKNSLSLLVLGNGSNLLVKDGGIRGVVVVMKKNLSKIQFKKPHRLCAMAGAGLTAVCRSAIKQGLKGLNFAMGIPGTVGGAIRMNAGAWGQDMGSIVRSLRIMNQDGAIKEIDKSQIRFSYRSFALADPRMDRDFGVILEGRFELTPEPPALLQAEADALLAARKASQPPGRLTAGCFFRNPVNHEPAGRLIDLAGGKALAVGDAMVSERHGNFIVNKGRATAGDVLRLKDMVQEAVFNQFNVLLEPEVAIVGEG